MNSDIIVMTFDGSYMAQTVYDALQAMRRSQVLGLGDSVVVTTDGAGQLQLHRGPEASTGLAPLLAEMILRPPEGVVPGPDGAKLDDEFVGAVAAALHHHRSALLFFIDADSLSDTCELVSALELFRGTVHQTTLCPQREAT